MGSKQCGRCGEVVDDAKAFCPGCGNAFVAEEERTTVSDFDMSNKTVQLGGTMYNQLLSDMGLSTSKSANKAEAAQVGTKPHQPLVPPPVQAADSKSTRRKWLIRVTIVALCLLFVLLIALLVILFLLWQRSA
jgi:hypothetical protein